MDDVFSDMTELIVVAGETGVGKTFVSGEIGDMLDAQVIHSDDLRHEIYDEPEYDVAESYVMYGEMFYRGRRALERGESVVLDATFSDTTSIDRAEHIANVNDADFTVVRVHCTDWQELRSRLEARPEDGAGLDVYHAVRERFDHIDRERVDIDTSESEADTVAQLYESLERVTASGLTR